VNAISRGTGDDFTVEPPEELSRPVTCDQKVKVLIARCRSVSSMDKMEGSFMLHQLAK
jgi:hypothetical protein